MEKELEYWRNVAVWLADCHAATMEGEGTLKRTSPKSRERMQNICKHAASMLGGVWPYGVMESDLWWVKNRLDKASGKNKA